MAPISAKPFDLLYSLIRIMSATTNRVYSIGNDVDQLSFHHYDFLNGLPLELGLYFA